MDNFPGPNIDKSAFSVVSLAEADDELSYWLTKTSTERLQALELVRQTLYGYTFDTAGLQRVFEIAQRQSC
jgi:hypothetical protein